MSGAVARTTESNSAMTFEHSGMPSYAPGDSALESRGADWLRTAKLSQNSSSDVWAPTSQGGNCSGLGLWKRAKVFSDAG